MPRFGDIADVTGHLRPGAKHRDLERLRRAGQPTEHRGHRHRGGAQRGEPGTVDDHARDQGHSIDVHVDAVDAGDARALRSRRA